MNLSGQPPKSSEAEFEKTLRKIGEKNFKGILELQEMAKEVTFYVILQNPPRVVEVSPSEITVHEPLSTQEAQTLLREENPELFPHFEIIIKEKK